MSHTMLDSERIRIKLYLAFGGFYYKTVAKRVYGKGNSRYVPSSAEVSRVGKIAREEGLSSRAWRKGEIPSAKRLLNRLGRSRLNSKPKLQLAM